MVVDELEAEDRKHSRKYWLLLSSIAVTAICVLTFLLLWFGRGDLITEFGSSLTLLLLGAFGAKGLRA